MRYLYIRHNASIMAMSIICPPEGPLDIYVCPCRCTSMCAKVHVQQMMQALVLLLLVPFLFGNKDDNFLVYLEVIQSKCYKFGGMAASARAIYGIKHHQSLIAA